MILLPGPKFLTHTLDQNIRHRRFLCTFVSCSAILKTDETRKAIYFTKTMNMEDDERFMEEALKEAKTAGEDEEIPIGAVVVCRGKIIAKGHNQTEMLHDPTAHAEMLAITAATEAVGGKYLNDCTIYVTVEPCPMCAAALGWAQIGRVVYGAIDPKRGYTGFSPNLLHPKTEVSAGVLADECAALMKDFFKDKR